MMNLSVISGDDNITLPIMALGGTGVISVAANVDPKRMVAMYEAMKQGDYQKALVLHYRPVATLPLDVHRHQPHSREKSSGTSGHGGRTGQAPA